MATATVRITASTRKALEQLARRNGQSLQATLDDAVEAFRRQRLIEDANAAFAAIRANPRVSEETDRERALWDNALEDGIEAGE